MVFLDFLLCELQFKHGGGCQNGSFTFLLSPHTKGRRRGSCVVPSASITSKNHDNTINPHFPSLYSWLPPCAVPLAGTCRPAGSQLAAAISSQSQQDELMNNFSLLVMFFIKQEYFLVIS
jgi:hypothetical protein